MARSWEQIAQDVIDGAIAMGAEATDDIRHKVVEQGFFGQEQTGYIQNIYGTDFTNQAQDNPSQNHPDATQSDPSQPIDPKDTYVRVEPRPNEQEGWWQGEPEVRAGENNSDNHTAHNGWEIGQDGAETSQTLEAEQEL